MEYTFKRINSNLYKDLVLISKSAFNLDPGINYYREKNKTSNFGEPDLGFIAYSENGEPAAFYGVYAYPVILNGQKFIAAQSGDTMTHKNHVGKGLFTTLAKMTYELAREKGIDFIFGFPNYNSYPGFVKKLNWTCPYNLKEFRNRLFTVPLAKLCKKFTFLNYIYTPYSKLIFAFYRPSISSFKSSVLDNNCGGVDRSIEFIKYKSFLGSRIISINGVHLWIKIDGFLFIGDIEKKESTDYKKLWEKVKILSFILGIDTIVFQLSPETYFDKIFSLFLKSKDAFPFGYLNLSGKVDPMKFKFIFADSDTF